MCVPSSGGKIYYCQDPNARLITPCYAGEVVRDLLSCSFIVFSWLLDWMSRQGRHVPRICPRGEVWGGPSLTPCKTQNSLDLGPYFLGGVPFMNEKIDKFYWKSLIWGPTQIAAGDAVTSKFEPHGLQRSPKGPFCSSSGVLCRSIASWYPKEPYWSLI